MQNLIALMFSICLFTSCNYDTQEVVNKTSKKFPNNITLSVEKITKETTSRGIFTNHNYGTSHNFTYSFFIKKKNIHWDGGSSEPKNILFYKNDIYVRYLEKKSIKEVDSINDTNNYHYEIQETFQKHIDERYFFKLFGDEYWIEISPKDYTYIKTHGEEYNIPNDNELSLKSIGE